MTRDDEPRSRFPAWIIPLATVVLVVAVSLGLWLYQRHLEGEIARLEEEKAQLEHERELQILAEADLDFRCPPVLELDPGWADRMPWGPGREEALPLLEDDRAEVRLLSADGTIGPTISWNPRFRLYDLASREGAERRDGFYIGVKLPDGSWARTVPSNWPLPLCEPWIVCDGQCDAQRCLLDDRASTAPLPPAMLPEACNELLD